MARTTPGNYVPLDVNYARDIAIRKAGPNAELLFLRALAYSKGARTSGFVSDFDLEVVAVGMRSAKAAADKLVEVGLFVREPEGWRVRSWERWNSEQIRNSAGGKLGNHIKWHVDTGKSSPDCEHCIASPPIAPRSHPDSGTDSPPESQGKGREGKKNITTLSESSDDPDLFDDFWRQYPRKDAKVDARKAWKQITKEVKPQEILDALTAYQFHADRNLRPMPATWLRGKRWEDESATLPVPQLRSVGGTQRGHRADGQLAPWER